MPSKEFLKAVKSFNRRNSELEEAKRICEEAGYAVNEFDMSGIADAGKKLGSRSLKLFKTAIELLNQADVSKLEQVVNILKGKTDLSSKEFKELKDENMKDSDLRTLRILNDVIRKIPDLDYLDLKRLSSRLK